jgi:hypothetical protein
MPGTCVECGDPVAMRPRGRPRRYCSRACQAKAYRARKAKDTDDGPMSDRHAARRAAFHAGLVIENAMANGWETLDRYGTDRPRVEAALNELCAELEHRAQTSRPQRPASPAQMRVETPVPVTKTAPPPDKWPGPDGRGHWPDIPAPDLADLPRDELPATVTEPAPPAPTEPIERPDAPMEVVAEKPRRFRTVGKLGADWATDDDDVLWWQQTTRVGSVAKAWPGTGWEARRVGGARLTTGSGAGGRFPSRIKALTMLAAQFEHTRRAATSHTDVELTALPGWRLTQTLADHDAGTWTLHAPDQTIAGRITRMAYGTRPQWRATAGDPDSDHYHAPVTPSLDDPDRGTEDDLWRTRTAAAHALARWHDPALEGPVP